eukprot:COSAG01_NODE_2020_length_8634_cov_4.835735_11_plen_72_part_00
MVPISIDDWFLKSNEFRLWLREEKGLNLFEMETVAGKKLFQEEFMPAWNGSRLWAKSAFLGCICVGARLST